MPLARSTPEDSVALRALAKALAPYLAEELERLHERRDAPLSPEYDAITCEMFISELGDSVIERSRTLFELLARQHVVDSTELASALGVTPRALGGYLTTPLKRRANALGLPLPFDGGRGAEPFGGIGTPSPDMDRARTHWEDRDGIAPRMLIALDAELIARTGLTASAGPSG